MKEKILKKINLLAYLQQEQEELFNNSLTHSEEVVAKIEIMITEGKIEVLKQLLNEE